MAFSHIWPPCRTGEPRSEPRFSRLLTRNSRRVASGLQECPVYLGAFSSLFQQATGTYQYTEDKRRK